MRTKTPVTKAPAEQVVKDIRRATRKHYSAEDKIRIVLEGLRGEDSIAELCRRIGIAQGQYYSWSKEFLEAGKRRLAGDTARAATPNEVKDLRREASALKEDEATMDRLLQIWKIRMAIDNPGRHQNSSGTDHLIAQRGRKHSVCIPCQCVDVARHNLRAVFSCPF